jgi:hypothetical protein
MEEQFDDLLGPTPQAHGFPEHPTTQQRNCWLKQTQFLEAFSQCGRIGEAAQMVGITRWAADRWQNVDLYSFRKRLEQAHQLYVESLEKLADDRLNNPSGNRGSDILLMFKMKAEKPEKYREDVKVVGIDASKMMFDKLREMASRDIQQAALDAPAVDSPAVEGVYTEVNRPNIWPVRPQPPKPEPVPQPKPTPKDSAKDRRAAQIRADRTARRGATNRVTRR